MLNRDIADKLQKLLFTQIDQPTTPDRHRIVRHRYRSVKDKAPRSNIHLGKLFADDPHGGSEAWCRQKAQANEHRQHGSVAKHRITAPSGYEFPWETPIALSQVLSNAFNMDEQTQTDKCKKQIGDPCCQHR